ncbi:MAG: transposase [Bacteriovoracaceae bacterium]|nr:transposase [Bacteriovoracaceae bacterium]
MKGTVFTKGSQQVNTILLNNPPNKVILIPVDFAKEKHVARCCFGDGSYMTKKPIVVFNNSRGLEFLDTHIQKTQKRYDISKGSIIIATEDPHSYAVEFFHKLRGLGYCVVQANASTAKNLRKNTFSSSDTIDLDGITTAVITRQVSDLKDISNIYAAIKNYYRNYSRYVKERTRAMNQITKLMDQIFPGFLSSSQSGLTPFSKSSLNFMLKGVSPESIKKMKKSTLITRLKKDRIQKCEVVAEKLKELAKNTLCTNDFLKEHLIESLKNRVGSYTHLQTTIEVEINSGVKLLLLTPYALLTSIPQIGIVRALTLAAEFGEITTEKKFTSMCAYAGIVPRTFQTGGPDKAASVYKLPKKCNHRIKNVLLSAAFDLGTTSHPAGRELLELKSHRLQDHFNRIEHRCGKSGVSTARVMLKIMRKMLVTHSIYLPYDKDLNPNELKIYIESTFKAIRNKFTPYIDSKADFGNSQLKSAEDEWKTNIKELYGIDLTSKF